MKRPSGMDKTEIDFWNRHAKRLEAEGLLNESSIDAFLILCRIHSQLINLKPDEVSNGHIRFFALLKQWQTYGRKFNLNSDKPVKASEPKSEVKDEFGL